MNIYHVSMFPTVPRVNSTTSVVRGGSSISAALSFLVRRSISLPNTSSFSVSIALYPSPTYLVENEEGMKEGRRKE